MVPYGSWYEPHPAGADRVGMVDGATLNLDQPQEAVGSTICNSGKHRDLGRINDLP
jgi:hypothetical protein